MISDRKLEHLLICKNYDVEFKNKKTGFEDVELIHKALPEIDKNEIDLSISVCGKKLDSPLFITAITGGHPAAKASTIGMPKPSNWETKVRAKAAFAILFILSTSNLPVNIISLLYLKWL